MNGAFLFSPIQMLMRNFVLNILAFLAIFCFSAFGDSNINQHYTKAQVEIFIREVFLDQSDTLVFESPSNRLALITGFLDRFEIGSKPEFSSKKFKLLSTVALNNKYNPALIRDVAVNPQTFNPLKYKFPMSSDKVEMYRVDGTDFIIIIQPIQ